MVSASPGGNGGETRYPVVANNPVSIGFSGALRAGAPSPTEHLTTIHTDISTQIGWLTIIEEALHELPHNDAILAEAMPFIRRLHESLRSSNPLGQENKLLWISIYILVAKPFIDHFGAAVGDVFGHTMANKIIEALSNALPLSKFVKYHLIPAKTGEYDFLAES
jgi:hypothetical protein